MDLVINQHIIDGEIETILNDLRDITDGRFLKDIERKGPNIAITCAFHKDGQENHPSCFVYARRDRDDVPYGFFKCFTCGTQGNLDYLVARCLNCSMEDAREWLIDNYSSTLYDAGSALFPDWDFGQEKKPEVQILDEAILDRFAYFHPYMFERKLTRDVVVKFKIGWNPDTDALTFPIRDDRGRLIGISERKTKYKQFNLPKGLPKTVYLLDTIKQEHIKDVWVVESQIDALYLWSIGIPAIALFGTGSSEQYPILQRSGIRSYHLALDGDPAGRGGLFRFYQNMPKDVFINVCLMPEGKDIDDLTPEEIHNLKQVPINQYFLDPKELYFD